MVRYEASIRCLQSGGLRIEHIEFSMVRDRPLDRLGWATTHRGSDSTFQSRREHAGASCPSNVPASSTASPSMFPVTRLPRGSRFHSHCRRRSSDLPLPRCRYPPASSSPHKHIDMAVISIATVAGSVVAIVVANSYECWKNTHTRGVIRNSLRVHVIRREPKVYVRMCPSIVSSARLVAASRSVSLAEQQH